MEKIILDKLKIKQVAIFLSVAILLIGGYYIFSSYQNQQRQTQTLFTDQQRALQDAQQKITDLQKSDEQNKQAQATAQKNINTTPKEMSDANIVSEWKNRIAQITCQWTKEGLTMEGSGTLVSNIPIDNFGLQVLTNLHVIEDGHGYSPNWCVVGVYNEGARTINFNASDPPFLSAKDGTDLGAIVLSSYVTQTDNGAFDKVATKMNICQNSDVSVGDKVVVLGYPGIGTTRGITATEGIVSGIEDQYYVTSAKIDHGNSGGAAILVKNDCWLGIPTMVEAGSLESLGRILKASIVFAP